MWAIYDISTTTETGLLALLVLFITKAGADHAWHLAHTRCVPRISADPFVLRWCEPHNAIVWTQLPFYAVLLALGCSPLSVCGTALVAYSALFQPLINAAIGRPFFDDNESDHYELDFTIRLWRLSWHVRVDVPKYVRGRRRLLFIVLGATLLWHGLL